MVQKLFVLCGDLGGTSLRTAVVEIKRGKGAADYRIAEKSYLHQQLPPNATLQENVVGQLMNSTTKFLQHNPKTTLEGVALAVAGPVWIHRILLKAPNISFLRERCPLNLAKELEEKFTQNEGGIRVIILNDLEAALAGEVEVGALKGCRWALMENIGTGWGGASLYNGEEVAGEPGHIWLPGAGKCGCGRKECAEARFSGAAIGAAVVKHYAQAAPALKRACRFVENRARKGDCWAQHFLREVAGGIGNIWGSRLNLCPPIERIVYMGSVIEGFMSLDFFAERLREVMLARSMFPAQHARVELVKAQGPRDNANQLLSPLLGAARVLLRLANLP
jgi:predicted NBD/HSP70 family sugar kinase